MRKIQVKSSSSSLELRRDETIKISLQFSTDKKKITFVAFVISCRLSWKRFFNYEMVFSVRMKVAKITRKQLEFQEIQIYKKLSWKMKQDKCLWGFIYFLELAYLLEREICENPFSLYPPPPRLVEKRKKTIYFRRIAFFSYQKTSFCFLTFFFFFSVLRKCKKKFK